MATRKVRPHTFFTIPIYGAKNRVGRRTIIFFYILKSKQSNASLFSYILNEYKAIMHTSFFITLGLTACSLALADSAARNVSNVDDVAKNLGLLSVPDSDADGLNSIQNCVPTNVTCGTGSYICMVPKSANPCPLYVFSPSIRRQICVELYSEYNTLHPEHLFCFCFFHVFQFQP